MVDRRRVRFVPLLHRGFSTGSVPPPPPPPRPVTLGSRPILFISTFLILHQSFATLSLLPVYGYFHYTDSSTAFLVGPHVTSLLRKPLPFSPGGRTVEDVLDTVVGHSIKTGWRFWNKWKGRKYNEHEGEEIAKEVMEELEEKRGWSNPTHTVMNRLKEMKDRAVALRDDPRNPILSEETLQDWKDWAKVSFDEVVIRMQALKNRLVEIKDRAVTLKDDLSKQSFKVNLNAEKLREWKDQVMESLPKFDDIVERKSGAMKAITDATAAYLVIKASAPLRLAVNLFLTPRLARVFVRHWG